VAALRVTRVVPESPSVTSPYLATANGSPLPAARPGQYLTLRLPDAGTPAPVRSYSLSSAPGADVYRLSVKHEPHGTASGWLTTRLRAGAVVDVAAPRGDFVLGDEPGPVLLISAGIGLTPVLAMLHALAVRGHEFEVWWIHGARGPDEHPLAAEVRTLLATLPHAREHIVYSSTSGRLTKDKLGALSVPADATAYLCGPAAFMSDMGDALAAGSAGHRSTGDVRPQRHRDTVPDHRAQHARTGGRACDVPARWSCRTGVCHTCVTPLLSGDGAYDPDPLATPTDGQVLICCARPDTDVVLDM
jgi:ferredoxin-NADP reductase